MAILHANVLPLVPEHSSKLLEEHTQLASTTTIVVDAPNNNKKEEGTVEAATVRKFKKAVVNFIV